jgi:hypothetical protein
LWYLIKRGKEVFYVYATAAGAIEEEEEDDL